MNLFLSLLFSRLENREGDEEEVGPSLGVLLRNLENPVLCACLRVSSNEGVLVRKVGPTSAANNVLKEIDLVGGYYDAGDNVKFDLPIMFWSIVEYSNQLGATGELAHAIKVVKWGTDYLIQAHPEPNVLYFHF